MSPVALLCGIISQSAKTAAESYRACDGYGDLVSARLVKRQGLVQSVLCDACDTAHDAPIVFEDGRYGHFCPTEGFVPVKRSELVAVVPDLAVLATQIADALGCTGRAPRCLANHTWNIGTVRTGAADIAVYFHACLQMAKDLQSLENVLRGQVRARFGLVLTAMGNLRVPDYTTATLDQMFGFDSIQGKLAAEAELSALVGAPVTRTGGRPATHADRINAIIADRAANGRNAHGQNAEIRAIQAEYEARFAGDHPPSRTTVMRYLPKSPGGL